MMLDLTQERALTMLFPDGFPVYRTTSASSDMTPPTKGARDGGSSMKRLARSGV